MDSILNPKLLDVVELESAPGTATENRKGTVVGILGGLGAPTFLIEIVDSEGVATALMTRNAQELKEVWSASAQAKPQPFVSEAQQLFENGLLLLQNGLLERAKNEFSRAFELDPKYAGSLTNLTNVLAEKGEFESAIAIYQMISTLRPEYPTVRENLAATFINRGIDLARRGLLERALDDLNSALLLTSSDRIARIAQKNLVAAYTQLGIAHTDFKRYDEAIQYLVRAFEIIPSEATAKNLALAMVAKLASVSAGRRNLDTEEGLRRAIQVGLTRSESLNAYGATLANLGWFLEAKHVLERALAADPSNEIARRNLNQLNTRDATVTSDAGTAFQSGLIRLEPEPVQHGTA